MTPVPSSHNTHAKTPSAIQMHHTHQRRRFSRDANDPLITPLHRSTRPVNQPPRRHPSPFSHSSNSSSSPGVLPRYSYGNSYGRAAGAGSPYFRPSADAGAVGEEQRGAGLGVSIRGIGTGIGRGRGVSRGVVRGIGRGRGRGGMGNVWIAPALREREARMQRSERGLSPTPTPMPRARLRSRLRVESLAAAAAGADGVRGEELGGGEEMVQGEHDRHNTSTTKTTTTANSAYQQHPRPTTPPPPCPPPQLSAKPTTAPPQPPPHSSSHQHKPANNTLLASLTHEIHTRTLAAHVHARRGERDKWLRNRDALAWLRARVEVLGEEGMGKSDGDDDAGQDQGREKRVEKEPEGREDGEWEEVEVPSSFGGGCEGRDGGGDGGTFGDGKGAEEAEVEADPYMCGDAASEVEDLLDWDL
ncbi:hypothetical protein IWX91DRAFT_351507 [Phyllosticta citricarpa]